MKEHINEINQKWSTSNILLKQIVIAADKNVGFVCMDTVDYLSQYEKINVQQHFGQVNISEKSYIEYISLIF